jgi:tetratricopeptide (TPR) repeat protein
VPLLVKPPRAPARSEVATPVSTAAVAPTILELAGVRRPVERSVSLLRSVESTAPAQQEPVISETLYLRLLLGWTPLYSARSGSHKIIDAPAPELYDLAADPGETADLAGIRPDEAARLRQALRRELAAAAGAGVPAAAASPDSDARDKLAALGYVSSGRSSVEAVEPVGGPDIRSRLPLWLQIEQALERSQKGDAAGAQAIYESVLRADADNVLALKFLGARALEAGDLARAVAYNERVVASGLHVGEALSNLALAYNRLGRAADALKAADAAIAQDPGQVAARVNRAVILLDLGRSGEAAREADEVLRRAPQHAGALQVKARAAEAAAGGGAASRVEALAARGDLPAAIAEAERAVRERPSDVALHDLLGVLLARSGQERKAVAAFDRALELSPDDADILERLGAVRHRLGDRAAARAAFERVLVLDPPRQAPRLSLAILDLEDGRPQRAAARLAPIGTGWPGAYQAQFYLAEARRASGDAEGARQAYEACLAMAPADSPVRAAAARQLAGLR